MPCFVLLSKSENGNNWFPWMGIKPTAVIYTAIRHATVPQRALFLFAVQTMNGHTRKKECRDMIVIWRLWTRSLLGGMNYYLLIFSFLHSGKIPVLTSPIQNGMPRKLPGTECLNTRLPLLLVYPGYSVALIRKKS